jgi:CheY-like chemotaxis protein
VLAANGKEALERLQGKPTPDVMLLDMMMSEMDGWQLLKMLRQYPDLVQVPVIIVTGAWHRQYGMGALARRGRAGPQTDGRGTSERCAGARVWNRNQAGPLHRATTEREARFLTARRSLTSPFYFTIIPYPVSAYEEAARFGSRQPTLPGNCDRLSGGCADVTEKKPADPNSLHEQARKVQEMLQRHPKEINELLDRTRGKDRSGCRTSAPHLLAR